LNVNTQIGYTAHYLQPFSRPDFMITATNLTMRFGAKILFKNVNFQLNPGQHYGLIGANGCGKSTLIKILIGDVTPEQGSFSVPSQFSIGTLKQDHFIYENEKILDIVLMGNPKLWQALYSKEKLLEEDHFTESSCVKLEELEKTINHEKGYAAPSEAAKLLEGLGIAADLHEKPLHVLSGGYKLRVLLAQVLFSNPDILLLDEPTNHLDIYSIHWLEGYLKSFSGAILLSSHDKDFLNNVCNYILDVDHETIKTYKGNYDEFLETKTANLEQRLKTLETQEKKREDLQEFVARFRAKASKAAQAQSKLKLVEKLEEEMSTLDLAPSSRLYPNFKFLPYRASGAIALSIKSISKNYGPKHVLENVSFEVERGDRIAILGANGIGKSTLLELLCGYTEATSGTFNWGHAVEVAYFPQDHKREIHGKDTLLDFLRQCNPDTPEQQLREILGRVLFSGDDAKKTTTVLSGGEMARLVIAKMMAIKHNVLIFDEPTNHLDMESTDALLEALENYTGTLIFVSHNRYFISKIANRIIEISKNGIKDFRCNYEQYCEKREVDLLSAKIKASKNSDSSLKDNQRNKFDELKGSRNLKNQIEKKITQTEKKCHEIEEKLKKHLEKLGTDGFYQSTPKDEIQKILAEQSALESALEQKLLEWEQLHEELARL
jgi:ATPase subunit of ABC transporter with duplicated ATPase domains